MQLDYSHWILIMQLRNNDTLFQNNYIYFQPDNNWNKGVFDLDSTNTRQIISIMHNYTNQHEYRAML